MVIAIDEFSSIPIYMQIRDQIVMGISDGRLREGDQLPTVRGLALEIGINTMTISKAYQILKQEGYIVTDRRSGARVAAGKSTVLKEESLHLLKRIASEAKLSGMPQEKFLDICKKAYGGEEV